MGKSMIQPGVHMTDDFIGCPDCDLLVRKKDPGKGFSLACPRCGAQLFKSKTNSMDRTLAFSLSGLFLFIPACFLPLLNFTVLGYSGRCTMIKAAIRMFSSGYWWMGFLVLFCSILAPALVLSILFMISLSVKYGKHRFAAIKALKIYHHLAEWAMLDVYMIGILVSLVKMKDYGEVISGLGLYSFIGLLAMVLLTMISFDGHHAWSVLENRT